MMLFGECMLFTDAAILACWLSTAAPAAAVTYTTGTPVDCGDTTYDRQDIIVDGCALTVNCALTLDSFMALSGAVGTHSVELGEFATTIVADPTSYEWEAGR